MFQLDPHPSCPSRSQQVKEELAVADVEKEEGSGMNDLRLKRDVRGIGWRMTPSSLADDCVGSGFHYQSDSETNDRIRGVDDGDGESEGRYGGG